MGKRLNLSSIAILLTIVLFGIASNLSNGSYWGINHLAFLDQGWMIAYLLISLLIITILFSKRWDKIFSEIVIKTHDFIFEKGLWPKVLIAFFFTAFFYVFRSETHFLGDGYTWLSVFSQGDNYIHKWSETGSIYLLRISEQLLGGYTEKTALSAFQIFSIFSGALVVYNAISIIQILLKNHYIRLISLFTIVFSGSLLLYFGYVEFYPLSWAVCILFINTAIRSLNKTRYLWIAMILFLLAIFMHVQAVYFLPGLLFLLINRVQSLGLRKIFWYLYLIFAIAGILFFIWLYLNKIEFEILILPFFEGRPVAPEYTVFSFIHLLDLINLLLLVVPGIMIMIALWISGKLSIKRDSITLLLGFLSVGPLSFLMVYGAAVTMARDWDVMTLSFIAPILFVLYQTDNSERKISANLVISYGLLVIMLTGLYITANVNTTSSENRYYSLLNDRNRSGWAIYSEYFKVKKDKTRFRDITFEMNSLFPEYLRLKDAYNLLEKGKLNQARNIAEELVNSNPCEPNFLQLLANVYEKDQRYTEATKNYQDAVRLNPYFPELYNEFGQMYMKQQKYDSALIYLKMGRDLNSSLTFISEGIGLTYFFLRQNDSSLAIADTLFMADPNSPGGHLLYVTIAVSQGNEKLAQYHFKEFLKYGQRRSDYIKMKKVYNYLL